MALRDKAKGPLGWILGVVGGSALLVGSFFAGVATADSPVDQEQASVTEQQDEQQDGQQNKDTESKTESEDQDGRPERGPRSDDDGKGPDGKGPDGAPKSDTDPDADADTKTDADADGGDADTKADADGKPDKEFRDGDIPGDGQEDDARHGHGHHDGPRGGRGADGPDGDAPAQDDETQQQEEPAA